MKFRNLARAFDTLDTLDGYSLKYLFKSQLGSFETSNPEGSVAKRRVLSLDPDLVIPARHCIRVLGETWVVGDGSVDGMANAAVRKSYWIRKTTDLFTYQTPGQAAIDTGGTDAYGQQDYLKDSVDPISSALYYPQFEVAFSSSETPLADGFLRTLTQLLRIRSVRLELSGFIIAVADFIGLTADISVTFQASTYVPSTDTYTGSTTTTTGILYDRSKEYTLVTQADPTYLAGDRTLVVAKSTITPVVGNSLSISSRAWRIETVTSSQDAWSLHIRPA